MPDVPPADLDAESIIAVLNKHQVAFIVIGGYADIISSKRAAARPKDFAVLPILEVLRDQLARGNS